MKISIRIGGILNLLLGVFHFAFWEIFNWPKSLECLSPDNSAILQVLNIHGAITILFFAYVSLFHTTELIETKIGRGVAYFIAFFYLIRIANEFLFWGMTIESLVTAIILLLLALLYILPMKQMKIVR